MTEGRNLPLSVLHIGAGRYHPDDRSHATLDIWRELAKGADRYTVLGRSTERRGTRFEEGNLSVCLVPSLARFELEFLATQFRAIRLADEVGAQVVVSQCPVFGGLAAIRIARRRRARTLLELHMSGYVEPALPFSRWHLRQRLSRWTLPRADRIRVLSEGMRTELLNFYGEDLAPRVSVLPPRVDLVTFSTKRRGYAIAGRPKVVMVGTILPRKGQLAYLKAVLGRALDVETWIVGEGPQRAECETLVKSCNAEDRVHFFGSLSHAQLSELLPEADAMVLYSSMEGTPRALMEGMAAGLPVVTTNAGFCADVVLDGVEGFVIDVNRPDQLVSRLQTLFTDEALRTRMGTAARRRVERDFDAAKVFEAYRQLIRSTAEA